MYTYLDQNLSSDLLNLNRSGIVDQIIKDKSLVISCHNIAEIFQREFKENIVKELKILEGYSPGYIIQESNTKATIYHSDSLLDKYDDWMDTTLKFSEIKKATFNHQFETAQLIDREKLIEVTENTLKVYRDDKYREIEGIDDQIQDMEKLKTTLTKSESKPFNPIQYLRNQIGTEPREISNIPPDEIFQYLEALFYKTDEGTNYYDDVKKELNKKTYHLRSN
jgi:hypothetical protein